MIDTLVVAKRRLDKRDIAYDPSALRLANLRKKYHLPNHFAHNALNDAVATAELLLAQIHHHEHVKKLTLKALLC
jgi:DNA polymerase-3 subunit epsilon